MNRKIMTAAILVLMFFAPLALRAQGAADEEAIKALVQTAYVDGLMNLGDLEKTKAGFHPDFVLLGVQDGKLTRFPIADWIASTEKRKAQGQKVPLVSCKFVQVDVTGNAAVVKLELHREGKHIFTDYLSLYKFPDGWKIVGKIYFRHA
jgi:ketosteroid isomerase-like protein